jgi:hypothetical protein
MVSGPDQVDTADARNEAIATACHQALLFGEFSAKAAGPETFDDETMQTYFLHYIFGALAAIGAHPDLPQTLGDEDRVNAMGRALMTFENATREGVMGTLKMIFRARDEAALKIQEEGREAAAAWNWGQNRDAVLRFSELLEDESNFPRIVETSPPLESSDWKF